ncbi:MAG TPA: ATP-binding protein, partial [Minicystis sp.]|nr:ATP-binding protein [Minicystis sp.]
LLVGIDRDGCVRLFNRHAERVTGFGREEVIGRAFAEALLPDALEEHAVIFARAARCEPLASELLLSAVRTKSGRVREIAWRLACAEDEGDDVMLFAVGQDVTDERARAAQVRQNEKLAAIGTLAAGLAHEIRNPLNGAQLHVTFLERGLKRAGVVDGETIDAVHVVSDEIRRLGRLVDEFLDFARPRPLDKRAVSLKAICARAVQLVARVDAPGVEVSLDLPSTDVEIEVDAQKTEQVLLNLLQNAVEAAAQAGGHVTLRARRQPRAVVVEVEDDGPGLPSPDSPIFDAFFTTKAKGTGLGLAIAHRIVSDHAGSIDVKSVPGKTVFRVTLPLRLG